MLAAEDLEDPADISISFLCSSQSAAESKALSEHVIVSLFNAPIF